MEQISFDKLIKGNVYYIDLSKDIGYKFRHRATFKNYRENFKEKNENNDEDNNQLAEDNQLIENNDEDNQLIEKKDIATFINIIYFKTDQLFRGWHGKAFWEFYKPNMENIFLNSIFRQKGIYF